MLNSPYPTTIRIGNESGEVVGTVPAGVRVCTKSYLVYDNRSGSSTGESVGLISRRFWVRVPAGLVGNVKMPLDLLRRGEGSR